MDRLTLPYRVTCAEAWLPEDAAAAPPMAPMPKKLPRRLSRLSRAVLSCVSRVAAAAGPQALQYPVVYASRYGEIARTLALFAEYEEYHEMSPAGFSVSVHNTPASLLGLATANCNSSCTLAAGADSLRAAVLEAALLARSGPCLLVYGDEQQMDREAVSAVAAVIEHDTQPRPLPESITEIMQMV